MDWGNNGGSHTYTPGVGYLKGTAFLFYIIFCNAPFEGHKMGQLDEIETVRNFAVIYIYIISSHLLDEARETFL
jgi:hypothetical protein